MLQGGAACVMTMPHGSRKENQVPTNTASSTDGLDSGKLKTCNMWLLENDYLRKNACMGTHVMPQYNPEQGLTLLPAPVTPSASSTHCSPALCTQTRLPAWYTSYTSSHAHTHQQHSQAHMHFLLLSISDAAQVGEVSMHSLLLLHGSGLA